MFTEREKQINSLPYEDLIKAYNEGSLKMYVDRGLAIQAAASGLPVSTLGTVMALAFPISIVLALGLGVFWSIWIALLALIAGVICFRVSRAETARSVRTAALENPKIFDILRKNRAIWFEEIEG